jgi:5-methyltetrahydrofolate--homocysteine methyltransferase
VVKIAPAYGGASVHVIDASRTPFVVERLLNPALSESFQAENRLEQERQRERYAAGTGLGVLPLAEARRFGVPFGEHVPETPEWTGIRTLEGVRLEELIPYFDWTPFFQAWEIRGTAARLLDGPDADPRVKELKRDADLLLERFVQSRVLEPRGVYGWFPAAREGDDIVLFDDRTRRAVVARLPMLRRQEPPRGATPAPGTQPCLADFVAPASSGVPDHVGLFAVTAGPGLDAFVAACERDHDDYTAILAKALADRTAEAFAEWLHQHMRAEWGYGRDEDLDVAALLDERYRGIRPAPGYPACPDHLLKRTIFDLLEAPRRAGITLTDSCAMLPASSVSAIVLGHPKARYFSVGRIGRDQLEDYARRRGIDVAEAERWLQSNLA